jgi:PAS domain S-box-containing protein
VNSANVVGARSETSSSQHAEISRVSAPAADLAKYAREQAALFAFTDRLHRAQSLPEAYDAALDTIMDTLHCDRAAILLFDESNVMKFVASRELSPGYRSAVEGHSPWQRGQVNAAPICVSDIEDADEPETLKRTVLKEGIHGLAFIPLSLNGELLGKFMTYYNVPHSFTAEENDLALMIARQLGFGIARMRAEDARRRSEDALNRERELFRTIMDRIPVMITLYDPGSNLLDVNTEFQRLSGWSAQEATGASLMEQCYPDRQYRKQIAAFMESDAERWMDVRMRTRDGRDIETAWANVHLSDGMQVGIGIDITERKRSENAREHLAAIVESSADAIISKDTDGVIISWNKGAERLFGYAAHEIIGKPVMVLIPEDRHNEEPEILRRIRNGERIEHYETVRMRKDGSLVDISLSVSPIRNDRGAVIGASKIARDITENKEAEAQRNLLVAELSHRVKNTLATVISIARQSFTDPHSEAALRAFDSRIRGLAQTHSRLAESNWAGVWLETLLDDELSPYRHAENVHIAGPAVALSPKCGLTLGMGIHELATNAAKYGALSAKTGTVNVSWTIGPDKMLHLNWIESGGPEVVPPQRTGFGRLLLERALAFDLKGEVELEFAAEGLRCTIAIPPDEYMARLS